MERFSWKTHRLIINELIRVCDHSLHNEPIRDLISYNDIRKSDVSIGFTNPELSMIGFTNPELLMIKLINHIQDRNMEILSSHLERSNWDFCGATNNAGLRSPQTIDRPFISILSLNAGLVEQMRSWVIGVNQGSKELNRNGDQHFIPWSIIREILSYYLRKLQEVIKDRIVDDPLYMRETTVDLHQTVTEIEEYRVSTKLSKERSKWMIKIMKEEFLPTKTHLYGYQVLDEEKCKELAMRCENSDNLSTNPLWIVHPLDIGTPQQIVYEDRLESGTELRRQNTNIKLDLLNIQNLIDERVRNHIPEGVYIQLADSMKKAYEKA